MPRRDVSLLAVLREIRLIRIAVKNLKADSMQREQFDGLKTRFQGLQHKFAPLRPLVIHFRRQTIMDDACEKMHNRHPSASKYRGDPKVLLRRIQGRDPDANHLSIPALRMILDTPYYETGERDNTAADTVSDVEKAAAIVSEVVPLSQEEREHLARVYQYPYGSTIESILQSQRGQEYIEYQNQSSLAENS
ncbi:hypothetical protein F5887DRAFT_1070968 [Amanita rubescens]|nr:hypothetical protein F5887DRAFT_1070968 [Amanita rubescens]